MLFVIGVPSSGYLRYLESLHFATLKLFIWIMPFRAKVNYETCHVNTISPEVEYPDRSPYSHYNCLRNMGTWILLAYINLNTRLLATSRCLDAGQDGWTKVKWNTATSYKQPATSHRIPPFDNKTKQNDSLVCKKSWRQNKFPLDK